MILYHRINEAAHRIFMRGNFHFHRVRSDRGSLPGTSSGVLRHFSVSGSHLFNMIEGEGIRLNFLRGSKARDATAPCIQKMMHCGIYFGRENALWDS